MSPTRTRIAAVLFVVAAAAALALWLTRSRGPSRSRGAAGTPTAVGSGAPGQTGTASTGRPRDRRPGQPLVPVEVRPDSTKVYIMDNGAVFRDHRGSDSAPPIAPPGLPPSQRTMKSDVTAKIYDQLKPIVQTCGDAVAAADRGAQPFVYVTLTVAVADGTLTATDVYPTLGDVEGPSATALVDCVRDRAMAVAVPQSGEPDRTDYIVQYPIRLR